MRNDMTRYVGCVEMWYMFWCDFAYYKNESLTFRRSRIKYSFSIHEFKVKTVFFKAPISHYREWAKMLYNIYTIFHTIKCIRCTFSILSPTTLNWPGKASSVKTSNLSVISSSKETRSSSSVKSSKSLWVGRDSTTFRTLIINSFTLRYVTLYGAVLYDVIWNNRMSRHIMQYSLRIWCPVKSNVINKNINGKDTMIIIKIWVSTNKHSLRKDTTNPVLCVTETE